MKLPNLITQIPSHSFRLLMSFLDSPKRIRLEDEEPYVSRANDALPAPDQCLPPTLIDKEEEPVPAIELRAYQLEMLERSIRENIIVAVSSIDWQDILHSLENLGRWTLGPAKPSCINRQWI